jgi:outer membrane receptor for ferrienterochelin and colicin
LPKVKAFVPVGSYKNCQDYCETQDGKDAQDNKVQQVAVHGSLSAYDPRRDDTASKIVVNHNDLVKYGDTKVLDVLKRVPGVTVSGNGGRGSEVRMRGLGGGYTQILINGEKAPPGVTIDSLAPDRIERIEVVRPPAPSSRPSRLRAPSTSC